MAQAHCDGCGLPASPEHIALRIRRIELATHFRPVHIHALFLAEAPPERPEDYFYYPAKGRAERGRLSRALFSGLMEGLSIAPMAGEGDEPFLAEFQRRGFFLADCLECPVADIVPGLREGTVRANAHELVHRYGATILRRIDSSYKPRHIVLLSTRTRHLIPLLQQAAWGSRLLLYHGLPLHFPHPDNPGAQAQFRAGMAEIATLAAWQTGTA
ncbi:MAG: hypothetical protein HY234_09225 [Acidobacteria bacterium]|nr:hypothetical protein [Acidobacteriota bacterium]MBI3663216.1 hypothetical protein [Acidobacteriota bacterium]